MTIAVIPLFGSQTIPKIICEMQAFFDTHDGVVSEAIMEQKRNATLPVPIPVPRPPHATKASARRRLPIVLLGNALMRVAGGASGILVGLYLADLANHGARMDAALVGTLGAVSFGAELLGSVPMGLLSDATAPRALMTGGALLGAAATQLFGMSGWVEVFFLSRAAEGLGAAAGVPPLLAHLTDVTEGDPALRSRVMSYFELSLLAGLALGGLLGSQLWSALHTSAFAAVATVYLLCAGLLFFGAKGSRGYGRQEAFAGFAHALREPSLRRLAPIWLCVNAIVGLWLGPTLTFLMTHTANSGQYLAGIFADRPENVGWLMLAYSLVFGAGVTAWSFVLPRMRMVRALRISLVAMLVVCLGLFLLNHAGDRSVMTRWTIMRWYGLMHHGGKRLHSRGSVIARGSRRRPCRQGRGDGDLLRAAQHRRHRRLSSGSSFGESFRD